MFRKIIILVGMATIISFTLFAQRIRNVQQRIENGRVVITYDLEGSNEYSYIVSITAENNTGNKIIPKITSGDIVYVTPGKNKIIYWEPQLEGRRLKGWEILCELKCISKNMVFVQGGTFPMGSNSSDARDNEKPVHNVTVDDFYISKYEVTNAEYIEFLNSKGVSSNGSYNGTEYIDMDDDECAIGYRNGRFYFKGSSKAPSKDCPVIEVTWYGANAYCKWKGGRLPTEAEWEYAARGGVESDNSNYRYSGSNDIDRVGWYSGNSDSKTHPVGQQKPNEIGIYDMSGNVWEWCSDWYDSDYYSSSPSNNPKGPNSGSYRVLRGGSWSNLSDYCRVAYRNNRYPDISYNGSGFRFVKSVE